MQSRNGLLSEMLRSHRVASAKLQQELLHFKSGNMHSSERYGGGPLIDTTARTITRLQQGIAEYAGSIAYLESELAAADV